MTYKRIVFVVLTTMLGASAGGLNPHTASVDAATTSLEQTYWHKVGADRFRGYDVGGINPHHSSVPLPLPGGGVRMFRYENGASDSPTVDGLPGYPPYPKYYTKKYGAVANGAFIGLNAVADYNYSQRVDWPVDVIFRNNANIATVKWGLGLRGLKNTGSAQWLSLSDSEFTGDPDHVRKWWDDDRGLKNGKCSNPYGVDALGPKMTTHIRLYADSAAPKGSPENDVMVNKYWGYYVLGTSHFDYQECTLTQLPGIDLGEVTWFGKSEQAEWDVASRAAETWGWQNVHYNKYWMDNVEGKKPGVWVGMRVQGDHFWKNDGAATVVMVGSKAYGSSNPGDEDDPPPAEGEEEGPPPPDPAKEGDVDGDDKADLVTLYTNGNAYTYKGSNGSYVASFSNTMEPAVFDADGFHVVDVADVNGDGYSDMTTVHSAGVIFTFMGKSDGSFGTYKEAGKITPGYVGPGGHEPIGVADVTGEGYADLVTFYPPQGNFYVYPGNHQGTFGSPITVGGGGVDSALFDRQGTWFLDVADIDGDGKAGVVGIDSSGKAVLYQGTSSGVDPKGWPYHLSIDPIMADGTGVEPVGVGDVNGDSHGDLAVLGADAQIAVYAGSAQGLATTPVKSLSSLNSSLLDTTGDDFVGLLDISGDNKADLVKVASNGDVYIAKGKEDLSFEAFSGKWVGGVNSNRFGVSPGNEMVQEKPYFRRYGCESDGCSGRPKPTESDVDGDRRSDLVTLDTAGTAHVYRAIGDESHATSFTNSMNSALFDNTGHHDIDTADVNGDGRSDKVTLKDNGSVYVHTGKADGTFNSGATSFSGSMTPGPHSPTGYEPIAVADVTGDGYGDLVAFKDGVGVNVYPGKSDATFSSAVTSLASIDSARFDQSGYHFLDAVDVTGDRRADLVASRTQDDTIRVFKGNVNGSFVLDGVSPLELKLDESPGQELLGLGDVNGDARADLATLAHGNVHVYEGRKSGEFLTEEGGGPWASGTSFAGSFDSNLFDQSGDEVVGLLDENGDRKADLVTVRSSDSSVRIYYGKATFTFNTTPTVRTISGLPSVRFNKSSGHEFVNEKPPALRAGCTRSDCPWPPIPFKEAQGDVDGDYRGDLVTVDAEGDAHVFAGGRNGFLTDSVTSLEGELDPALLDGKGHYLVDVADVDDDDNSDLITVKDDGDVLVHLGTEERTFETALDTGIDLAPTMNGEGSDTPTAVADVTGDGFDDLVVFIGEAGTYRNAVYKGQSDGKFSTSPVQSTTSGYGFAKGFDVADVTGDGLADLVAVMGYWVYVYPGTSSGQFGSSVFARSIDFSLEDGVGQEPIGLGDVTGDGRADLLTLDGSTLKLWTGKSDGTLAASTTAYGSSIDSALLDGDGLELLGLLDYDADGRADLVAADADGDLLAYKAQAEDKFAAPVVSEGDLNTVKRDEAGHEILLTRPFQKRPRCVVDGCPWPPVQPEDSDVDGDGRADLVTLHTNGTVFAYGGEAGGFNLTEGVASFAGSMDPALFDGSGDFMVDVADVDGDFQGDLVTQTEAGDVYVHPGQDDLTFDEGAGAYVLDEDIEDVEAVAAADVTGDHRADLVQFGVEGSEGLVLVAPGLSDGTFSEEADAISLQGSVDSALRDGSGQYFLDASDVTGDERADLVSMSTSGTVYVYKGQSDGKFGSAISAITGVDPIMDNGSGQEPIGLGDVTGDGMADLLTLNGTAVKLYAGKADGTLASAVSPGSHVSSIDSNLMDGSGRELVGLLDYNRDNRDDLVIVSKGGGLSRHEALADGTFSSAKPTEGLVRPNRFGKAPARQMVNEKPQLRRAGCSAEGCQWPPAPVVEPEPETEETNWYRMRSSKASSSLEDVWCPVSNSYECIAVGDSISDPGLSRAQFSVWDGSYWTRSWAMSTSQADFSEFSGVVCQEEEISDCTAVGSFDDSSGPLRALIMDWNGSSWSSVTAPLPSGAKSSELTDISCPSASVCMAVGSYVDSSGITRTMAMRWNGTSWSLTTTPGPTTIALSPSGSLTVTSSELTGVSCPITTACTAVGSYVDQSTGTRKGLAFNWNGTTWTAVATPDMESSTPRELTDVSCWAGVECVAVGTSGEEEAWVMSNSGSGWSTDSTPELSGPSSLAAIDCESDSVCLAAGGYEEDLRTHPLVLAWDGSDWSQQPIESPISGSSTEFAALSCAGIECNAVGTLSYGNARDVNLSFIGFEGSWAIADNAEQGGGVTRGISCVGAISCVAVGDSLLSAQSGDSALSSILTQGDWSAAKTAEASWPVLEDVSCTAYNVCTAVGSREEGSSSQKRTLVETWNGSAWTTQSSPAPSNYSGGGLSLKAISCVYSEGACGAVGSYWNGTLSRTLPLAMSRSGSTWTLRTVPTPGTPYLAQLQDVSCTGSYPCFAVGDYRVTVSSATQPLLEYWDGSAWSLKTPPLPSGTVEARLDGVSCTSSSACTAVGFYATSQAGSRHPLIMRWNGSSWALQTGVEPEGFTNVELRDVSCYSATACVAVGTGTPSSGGSVPVVNAWNGSSWALETNPTLSGVQYSSLSSVSCAAADDCVATGSREYETGYLEPLILAKWE